MSVDQIVEQAAQQLWNAQERGIPCSPVREIIGATDIETAYAVQRLNVNRRLQSGAKRVGAKIGLTSVAVQAQLGVDQQDFGILFHDTEVENGTSVLAESILQPKAEAEIAFVLNQDLPEGNYTEDQIIQATEYVCAAIEIVGSRVEGWNIRITDTVADNASASHFVLGNQRIHPSQAEFVNCAMTLTQNGQLVSQGSGAACMGSPVKAVAWLANTMVQMGTPLQKGDIVLSGALGPMVAGVAGDVFEACIEGYGSVSFSFS